MLEEKKKPGCLGQIILIVLILSGAVGLSILGDRERRNETPDIRREKYCGDHGKINAYIAAESYVTDRLKAPSTAKFGGYDPKNVLIVGPCKFFISGYVDAQNSFGAMIRNNYYVSLEYDPMRALHIPEDIRIGR